MVHDLLQDSLDQNLVPNRRVDRKFNEELQFTWLSELLQNLEALGLASRQTDKLV